MAGAGFYVLTQDAIGRVWAASIGMVVVAGLRLASILYRWNLPRFQLDDRGVGQAQPAD
jgi:uncharacterized membrane protein YeiH